MTDQERTDIRRTLARAETPDAVLTAAFRGLAQAAADADLTPSVPPRDAKKKAAWAKSVVQTARQAASAMQTISKLAPQNGFDDAFIVKAAQIAAPIIEPANDAISHADSLTEEIRRARQTGDKALLDALTLD